MLVHEPQGRGLRAVTVTDTGRARRIVGLTNWQAAKNKPQMSLFPTYKLQ